MYSGGCGGRTLPINSAAIAAVATAVAAFALLHDLDADDGAGVALVLQVQRR